MTEQTILPEPPRVYRWLVLLMVSLAMFANYYVFDALNPVGPLLESELEFSQAQIGLLDTAYNIAALLVLIAGGVIIDRFGTKRSLTVFAAVSVLGGLLIAFGSKFEIMMAGRFVLGLGSEPLIVAVTTALAKWFKGKELSFAMGINLMIARFGSFAADNTRSWAAPLYSSWQPVLLLAAAIGTIAVITALLYWYLESRATRMYTLGQAGATDKLVFADLVKFGKSYWWVVGLCVTFYSVVFPFRRFANLFLTDAHHLSPETAGFLNGLLPLTAMFATPLFGLLADKIGKRALLMTIGSAFLLPSFLMLAFTTLPVEIPIAMIGIAFSLVPAVMWPAVAYLVDESKLGTAYALMTFCQQIGWALVAWLIGQLNDWAGASAANPVGYNPGMILFASLGLFGFLFSYLLKRSEASKQ